MADIPYSIRNLHVNIVGNIGCGKSSLITWWAWHDIISEHGGVCVIDPAGDLVDELLRWMPEDRVEDCIVADIDNPLPLDFISCEPGGEDDVVADLQYMLMGEMAGNPQYPRINKNVENLLRSLISANTHPDLNTEEGRQKRCTFLDVSEFWENEDRRNFIIRHIVDLKLKTVWDELPNKDDRGKITDRINPFIRKNALSVIFGEPNPRLDIRQIIRDKKILLVRVPVVKSASAIYGKLLIAKIQHAMFSVADKKKRIPFFLYVDEFQNFPTSENFEHVIDMGRKFLLCLTLSITRLDKLTASMRSALGGLGSYILFQLNPEDASFYRSRIEKVDPNKALRDKYESAYLEWQISPPVEEGLDRVAYKHSQLSKMVEKLPPRPLTIQDAIDLKRYYAIYRIGDEKPVIEKGPEPNLDEPSERQYRKIEYIKAQSLKNYGPRPATSAQRASGDNRASNSPQAWHDEGNGNTDTIKASGTPTPADFRENKDIGATRRIFHAADKGHRPAPKKPDPKRQ